MTPPQPSSQTLRERIQECLDSDGSKTWRAELLEECLAALAAQEARHENAQCVTCGAHLDSDAEQQKILAQPVAEASPQPDLARAFDWAWRDGYRAGQHNDEGGAHQGPDRFAAYLAACRQEQP